MHVSLVHDHFQVVIIILYCEAAILSYVIGDTKLVPKFSNVDIDLKIMLNLFFQFTC